MTTLLSTERSTVHGITFPKNFKTEGMILESDCNKVKFNEMCLAEKQMERIPETIGSIPYIIIMDRDYPSTPAFIHMMDKDIKFIVRLKSSDYKKEQTSLTEK